LVSVEQQPDGSILLMPATGVGVDGAASAQAVFGSPAGQAPAVFGLPAGQAPPMTVPIQRASDAHTTEFDRLRADETGEWPR
jgi:hypothetical protein